MPGNQDHKDDDKKYELKKGPENQMKSIDMLGYSVNAAGLSENTADAWRYLESQTFGNYMACLNLHSVVEAEVDKCFHDALVRADILLPDGIGIIIAARILGLGLKERVAGFDFFLSLTREADSRGGLRYFFLGSTNAVLAGIVARLNREYPHIKVCGVYSPPFKKELSDSDTEKMICRVNEAQPDVLWVGMTAPKQEKWAYRNRHHLNVPLIGAIGAVFDCYAGTKYRAPDWVCKLGMEWLPRFVLEPRRLWRRNLVSTPLFLLSILKQKYRGVVR